MKKSAIILVQYLPCQGLKIDIHTILQLIYRHLFSLGFLAYTTYNINFWRSRKQNFYPIAPFNEPETI